MSDSSATIDTLTLSKFTPMNTLNRSELEILAGQVVPLQAKKGVNLAEFGTHDDQTLYLVKGLIKLTAEDGQSHTISDDSPQALAPISHLNPHRYTVTCVSPVTYFRVDNAVIETLLAQKIPAGETVDDLFISMDMLNNPLFKDIYRDLMDDKLVIPAFPDIALKIQHAVKQDADLSHIERIIQFDPAAAAMIIKAANSALYNTGKPVKTIDQAVMRMGLRMVRHLVITYAIREMFNSRFPVVNQHMKRLWKHSAEVAATTYVLAKKLGQWDADHALLLGLLHDIGMLPILRYAEQYPDIADNEETLDATVQQLHCDIGEIVLHAWHFDPDFVQVSRAADDWHRDPQAEPDYCDLVLIAQLHTFIGKSQDKLTPIIGKQTLPNISELPAFRKLCLEECGPEESIAILNEANQQIHDTLQLLL